MKDIVEVLSEIRDELKTQNERLERIESELNKIYGALP